MNRKAKLAGKLLCQTGRRKVLDGKLQERKTADGNKEARYALNCAGKLTRKQGGENSFIGRIAMK